MAVADNRAYDYSKNRYYNSNPMPQQPEQLPKQTPVQKPSKRVRPKTHIVSIVFIFSICIFIISRYAYIAEINFTILNLDNDYKNVLKENSELNVQLAKTINLGTLEKAAVEKLHMQYPDVANQIVYLNVEMPQADSGDKYKEYYEKSDVMENKYVAIAKEKIDGILKILD